jgi:hypothetical protein
MRASLLILALAAFAATALAIYPPFAPLQGSYTWELVLSDNKGPEAYTGGRTIYDFVSGYVRMESWNTPDPNPGINGVTIWDLREAQPVVWTIDSVAQCWVQKLDSNVTAPMPPDFSGYSLVNVTYFNRALAEQWGDGYGGVVYVDVFSRDIVGMGNTSTTDDGESIFWNIQSWKDTKPDGTEFLLPNTIPCKQISSHPDYATAMPSIRSALPTKNRLFGINIKCTACKLGIGLIIGRLCSIAGAAACAPFPPAIPFCSILAGIACGKASSLGKDKACKIIHAC